MKCFTHGVGLRDLSEDEINRIKESRAPKNLEALRIERNKLLSETDYMALSDVTMSDAFKKYRQELRDITKTFKSMDDKDFKFPTKPTV
tara:strand:+ start:851 stop:1117 length:267 start_codon:yes stop_codon:yes gene_type:complete